MNQPDFCNVPSALPRKLLTMMVRFETRTIALETEMMRFETGMIASETKTLRFKAGKIALRAETLTSFSQLVSPKGLLNSLTSPDSFSFCQMIRRIASRSSGVLRGG